MVWGGCVFVRLSCVCERTCVSVCMHVCVLMSMCVWVCVWMYAWVDTFKTKGFECIQIFKLWRISGPLYIHLSMCKGFFHMSWTSEAEAARPHHIVWKSWTLVREFVRTSCVKHEFVRRDVCETCVWEMACVCNMSSWEQVVWNMSLWEEMCVRHEFGRRRVCATWVREKKIREKKSVWDICSWETVCVRNAFVRSNVRESSGDEVCVRHEFVTHCRSFPLAENVMWKKTSNELTSLSHSVSHKSFLTLHQLIHM